jgi:hypothetical protein
VVINAFSKLASPELRAGAEEALAAAMALRDRLAESSRRPVHLMPFGWQKRLSLPDVFDGDYEQTAVVVRAPVQPVAAPEAASRLGIRTLDGLLVPARP